MVQRVPLEAIKHLTDIGTGDTRPQLFLCDRDGEHEQWVLKHMGLSSGELAADLIGSLLALKLGIHCPAVEIANVTAAALLTAPPAVQAWARPGPAFASKLVERVFSGLSDADVVERAPADLGRMYALDAWLEVLDRRKPDGIWNVLEDMSDNSLIVLDFGKSLSPCLQTVIGGADQVIEPDYPQTVRQAASLTDALRVCDTIESVSRADLVDLLASVPDAWVTDEVRSKVVRFLLERAEHVRAVCLRSLGGAS